MASHAIATPGGGRGCLGRVLVVSPQPGLRLPGFRGRQKAILQPIASAIAAERPQYRGFDATLLAWRRATAAAALGFLDDITPSGASRA